MANADNVAKIETKRKSHFSSRLLSVSLKTWAAVNFHGWRPKRLHHSTEWSKICLPDVFAGLSAKEELSQSNPCFTALQQSRMKIWLQATRFQSQKLAPKTIPQCFNLLKFAAEEREARWWSWSAQKSTATVSHEFFCIHLSTTAEKSQLFKISIS